MQQGMGGANVTRQAETGMIQPCSEDRGRQGETEMHEEEEGRKNTESTW